MFKALVAQDYSSVINPKVYQYIAIYQGYDGRFDTSYALTIWSRHYEVESNCDEILIIGGIFGYSQGSSAYNYPTKVRERLLAYLEHGVKVTIFLQKPEEVFLHYVSELFGLETDKLILFSKNLIQACSELKEEWALTHPNENDKLQIFCLTNLYSWEYHGLYSDPASNPDAISYIVPLYQMLRAQFKRNVSRFTIYEHKNVQRDKILLDEDSTFRAKFLARS